MNKVFLNDQGLVEQVFGKRQTFRTIMATAAKLMVIVDSLPKARKNVDVLVDMAKVSSVTPDAMLAVMETMKTDHKGRAAVFGGSKIINGLASILISAAKKDKRIRIFETRAEALRWLLHGS